MLHFREGKTKAPCSLGEMNGSEKSSDAYLLRYKSLDRSQWYSGAPYEQRFDVGHKHRGTNQPTNRPSIKVAHIYPNFSFRMLPTQPIITISSKVTVMRLPHIKTPAALLMTSNPPHPSSIIHHPSSIIHHLHKIIIPKNAISHLTQSQT